MNPKKRFTVATIAAALLAILVTSTAFAHSCFPADKPPGAGSVGTYNLLTGEFTPSREHGNLAEGGFVTFTDGVSFSIDIFLNQFLPEGALEAGPEGDNMCDGHGIDFALACLGIAQ